MSRYPTRRQLSSVGVVLALALPLAGGAPSPAAAQGGGPVAAAETDGVQGELLAVRRLADGGDVAGGLRRLDALLARHPGDLEALFVKGLLLIRAGRSDDARSLFAQLSDRAPGRPEPHNNLGVALAGAGRLEEAAEAFESALRSDAACRVAFDNLRRVNGELASRAYSQALEIPPPATTPALRLGLLDLVAGDGSAPVPATPSAPTASASPPAPPARTEPPELAAAAERGARTERLAGAPAAAAEPATPPVAAPSGPADPAAARRAAAAALPLTWAGSWSSQRVDSYLGFYSSQFRPPAGMSRADWEALRRERLTRPVFIDVKVTNVVAELAALDRAWVRFVQSYRSDTFRDVVLKTLDLHWEDGSWKIVAESTE